MDFVCFNKRGLITYTEKGYMAVGINCMQDAQQPSSALYDNIFYTGTYTIKDQTVIHHIQNSNDPMYYGKDLTRDFRCLDSKTVVLTGKGKAGRLVRLTWTKLKQASKTK